MISQTLHTENLSKIYRGRKVIKNCSIQLKRGECLGLLGPNGAGKTTFFRMLAGIIQPSFGRIFLGNVDISHLPMYMRGRLGIRYLPQESSIFKGLSVEDNIMAILEILVEDPQERNVTLEKLLDEFNITHIRKNKGQTLSGGERRRVEIARAVIGDPAFILFDEPLAGIDPKMAQEIRSIMLHLKKRKIGLLITEHNVRETFAVVDRVYVIYDGRILKEGPPKSIVKDDEVRNLYLGSEF
jgi:lipopolysaccharide export system ATP-binding protein